MNYRDRINTVTSTDYRRSEQSRLDKQKVDTSYIIRVTGKPYYSGQVADFQFQRNWKGEWSLLAYGNFNPNNVDITEAIRVIVAIERGRNEGSSEGMDSKPRSL